MKILLSVLFACVLALPSMASDLDQKFNQANQYFQEEDYIKAIELYESILDAGQESAELYYNLGNAYYKNGQVNHAILNYERAKVLAPTDEYVLENLALANMHVTDKIDVLPELLIGKWFNNFINSLKPNTWALVSMLSFVLFIVLISIYLLSHKTIVQRITFILGMVMLLGSLSNFYFAYKSKKLVDDQSYAIVFSPTVTVKSSPSQSGTDLFIIHEGLKVQIKDKLGDWREVKISDGRVGWVMARSVRKI